MISRSLIVRGIANSGRRPRGGVANPTWDNWFAPQNPGFDWGGLVGTGLSLLGNFFGGGSRTPATIPRDLPTYPSQGPTMYPGPIVGVSPEEYLARASGRRLPRPRQQAYAGERKKIRHMNMCNQRALNRAIRRISGFQHLVKRSGVCAVPHRPKKTRRACKCRS